MPTSKQFQSAQCSGAGSEKGNACDQTSLFFSAIKQPGRCQGSTQMGHCNTSHGNLLLSICNIGASPTFFYASRLSGFDAKKLFIISPFDIEEENISPGLWPTTRTKGLCDTISSLKAPKTAQRIDGRHQRPRTAKKRESGSPSCVTICMSGAQSYRPVHIETYYGIPAYLLC